MMVLFGLLGIAAGIALGMLFPGYIPKELSIYVAVAVLAGIDSLLGGLKAYVKGTFKLRIFVAGFLSNIILAILVTYIGKLLGVDVYLIVLIVFGTRMFKNIAELRRRLLKF